jgi:ABC-type transport system involved in cytochrome c biogenesis ATPase subunit
LTGLVSLRRAVRTRGDYDRVVAEMFVGRADELALLGGLVAGLSAGVGGVALVEGEQGIGKSSVLRAGLAGAEAGGCRVL